MAKINILDSSVFNRIAAGEVVDRPYSVVKEFVENSLDAGAKNITVEIERGGKDRICVTDDGDGIERGELRAAFLPHATSKIERAEDLDHIHTLGFRGEALASIASVARVTLRSRAKGAAEAYEIRCDGGALGESAPCALGGGTAIEAEALFYNTPVRAKFLRTDRGEEGEITNFVSRFILGHPDVAFRYLADGKLVLQSFGGGLEEAVAAVYGAGVLAQCYHIDAIKHGIRLYGYLGKPSFAKANRTYQSVFVNGRYIVNQTIGSAIANAYGGYLMKRQYPFYVLFLCVPPEIVDVNVHPNKADVRFENNQVVYGSVYSVVSAVLDGNAAALDFIVGAKEGENGQGAPQGAAAGAAGGALSGAEPPADAFKKEGEARGQTGAAASQKISELPNKEETASGEPIFHEYTKDIARLQSTMSDKIDAEPGMEQLHAYAERPYDPIVFRDSAAGYADAGAEEAPPACPDVFAENKRYLEELERKAKQQKWILDNAVFRGVLFNTYLLYEEGDDVYIIDQHAAHERLIFDRLKAEMDARTVVRQPMLVPYILTVNAQERTFLSDHLGEIEAIGFDAEEFGGTSFKISAVPLDLQDIDLGAFFADLFAEVGSLRGIRLSELLRDRIAMTACKHAVKGGMLLTDSEKEKLFSMLHGDLGLKCPHGRPVCIRLTKTEIEKMFKRIV